MYEAFIQCMKRGTMVEGNQIQKASLESCVSSRGISCEYEASATGSPKKKKKKKTNFPLQAVISQLR